jgi:hypothetical protein
VATNEAEGFFPEREVLRARRLKAMAAEAVDPSEARTRRIGIWITMSVAVFLPLFVSFTTSGWDGHMTPRSAKVIIFALRLVLAICAAVVAFGIWKNLRRANNPSC